VIELLQKYDIDLIVLAGFMKILSSDFIDKCACKIINVHPALIPSFCGKGYYGLRVHEAALKYGVKLTGATVHFVNEVADGGKIILQMAVPVLKNDTPVLLQKRVMEKAEWVILPKAVELVAKEILKENKR
jgi:phosphoribosylglycinamide formyltransferase-1